MKYVSYAFMFCFVIVGLAINAHPNCLMVLLRKIKGGGYHPIGESAPILIPSRQEKSPSPSSEDVEIPTLAQDPAAFARYYWGFHLSFFDKN